MTRARCVLVVALLCASTVAAGCGSDGQQKGPDSAGGARAPSTPADGASDVYRGKTPELVKAWVDAVESCATHNLDGSYSGCTDRARLIRDEPRLADAPGTTTIGPGDDPKLSYEVVVKLDGVTFTHSTNADGKVEQRCSPPSAPACGGSS